MNTRDLVTAAMKAAGNPSIRAFAEQIGVSHTAVGKWLDGTQVPTFEQAAELAQLAGLPAVKTAAQVRLGSKDGAKHRALLRQLATAAALVLASALPLSGQAAPAQAERADGVGIMRSGRRWAKFALRRLFTAATMPRHGSPALLA